MCSNHRESTIALDVSLYSSAATMGLTCEQAHRVLWSFRSDFDHHAPCCSRADSVCIRSIYLTSIFNGSLSQLSLKFIFFFC